MTWHIHYDHQCSKCEAHYVPFDDVEPCPQCGEVEAERFDFIPQAAGSALSNTHGDGSYMPGAWFVGSLGDHLLHLLFAILEKHRTSDGSVPFDALARSFVDKMEWGDQEYMRDHLFRMSVRVFEEIEKRQAKE